MDKVIIWVFEHFGLTLTGFLILWTLFWVWVFSRTEKEQEVEQ
jgi:hypothetical protein